MIGQVIADWLFNEDVKNDIIKTANDHVDIPFINEETEKKGLEALWKIFEMVIRSKLAKLG
tara:strand:+ start:1080 stop:1262 length:183 start_codon:yes stop_codon:yes gene_type:complete